jgi:hypothetical protein
MGSLVSSVAASYKEPDAPDDLLKVRMHATCAHDYETIRQAIIDRRSLTCTYDTCTRLFSPHILGKSLDGREFVIGFQYAGKRGDGPLSPGGEWCSFYLDEISRLRLNGDRWVAGPLGSRPTDWRTCEIDVKA